MTSKFVIDAQTLDTEPGHPESPFSPPADWTGDDDAYLTWLRSQFKASPWVRQRLGLAARRYAKNEPLDFQGRFGALLPTVLDSMLRKIHAEQSVGD
ncbi:hypothetical protein [Methylomonas koyamae]|uniref:hypothetical protein n=1 Tax=Methylomonas koyamae TaxID=702114 RepID=UPI0006D100F6|nr:hypothetical protein [Methylomonas koyamae]BBL60870.1 hypothetical protein MKFW12EY_44830 [Methylomonas koyamae]